MLEILSLIPATAWSAIVTAMFTSSIAFFGISYTNKKNLHRMNLQHEHEIKLRDKEIMRDRAEELYVNVKSYGNYMFASHMPYHMVMKGEITYNDALDMTKEGKHDAARIEMIAHVYFPEVNKKLSELVACNDKVVRIREDFKEEYKRGLTSDEHYAGIFLNKLKILTEKIRELESCVATECKKI